MRYNNYHKHDMYGNPWIKDSIARPEEYCKRAVELGHTTVFTTNHAVPGNVFQYLEYSKMYGLKMCYAMEAYYVHDRFSQDRSNRHLVLVALNNNGARQINKISSEAHETGFYYRPRIDDKLIASLDAGDIIVTSACVAGIWNDEELICNFHRKFSEHFFLEVQNHNIDIQKEANRKVLELSQKYDIKLIHANDSHYIYPEDAKYRDIYINGHRGAGTKNVENETSEVGMRLDYPDDAVILQRYDEQNVLPYKKAEQALEETLVFDECEEITLINDDIKLPQVSEDPNGELKKIINERWKEIRKTIPKERHKQYLQAIREEVKTIEDTNMANYFLIDYHVAKDGQEKYDGRLTNTGRGSAPSFYTTKVLGLTDIDRIASPITLFPSRFMSTARILGSRSLPDIDMNTTDREPFIKATEDLLGAENCAWMLAWKPLQESMAFRCYCKGIGKNISEYEEVAMHLDEYRDDPHWSNLIKESERFVGVIETTSESPCSMLLYDKPVREELGMVRTPSKKCCCLLDGYNCDKYKYLKND